ncbi:hypothetical protein ACRZ5S_09595 [Vibrio scophthalmi]|uniref:hypothetical protein n=1 Tax=Vibrio scophthalmi TaxID=45658 RepID=UPI003EBAB295
MFFKKKRVRALNNIKENIIETITLNRFQEASKIPKRITDNNNFVEDEVVVSLTTYSKRINDVYLVIESIAQQTIKPNRFILWLSDDEFTIDTIPQTLKCRLEQGLEVRFCKDIKSYKKIVPTLDLCPNSIIITIDDDYIYPHDTIESLLLEHRQHPKAVIGNRAHEIVFKSSEIDKYRKWNKEVDYQSKNLFVTGCGGILYPPKSLHPKVMDIDLFTELSPHADDLWLFAMAKLNGTEIRRSNGRRFSDFVELPGNKDMGLNQINVKGRKNDDQMEAICKNLDLVLV